MEDGRDAGSDLVYHYTTAAGLKGIIENRCIWATNINFLNDISEYHHGVEIVREEIKEYEVEPEKLLAANVEPTSLTRWMAKSIVTGNIERQLAEIDYSLWTFATSFFDSPKDSTEAITPDPGDVLEQWRAYSRDSVAFSIGFNKSALERHVSGYDYNVLALWTIAGRCSYELKHKKENVKRIIDSAEPLLRILLQGDLKGLMTEAALATSSGAAPSAQSPQWSEFVESVFNKFKTAGSYKTAEKELGEVFPHFMGELMAQPALMKDRAFVGEKEWRLAAFTFDTSKILLRTSKSGLIPYVEIPFTDPEDQSRLRTGLIKRVVVGPLGLTSERESKNAISAVKMLLHKNKIPVADTRDPDGAIIESSRIPTRNW
jgi:hypothetical protein